MRRRLGTRLWCLTKVIFPAISFTISGFAQAKWSEKEKYKGKGGKTQTRTQHYIGREDYLKNTTNLIGNSDGPTFDIMPGIHSFDIQCRLPTPIPSSFEGGVGHIRYITTVSIHRSGKPDKNFTLAFTVLKPLDLNYESPELNTPVQLTDSKNFFCWPCKSGPLVFTATLPQTGFVPGQSIPITLDIVNNSNIKLEEIIFKLKEKIRYTCEVPHAATKFEEREVVKVKADGVDKQHRKHVVVDLELPAIPPTNTNLCRIIQISYELVIRPKSSGGVRGLKDLEIPVTIGTIPLTSPTIIPAQVNETASAPSEAPEFPRFSGVYRDMVAEHPELAFMRELIVF